MELQFGVLGVAFDAGIYKMFMAAPLVFEKGVEVDAFAMAPAILPDAGLHRIAFVGVTFYQELNGVKYVLKEDGNVGVEVVEGQVLGLGLVLQSLAKELNGIIKKYKIFELLYVTSLMPQVF